MSSQEKHKEKYLQKSKKTGWSLCLIHKGGGFLNWTYIMWWELVGLDTLYLALWEAKGGGDQKTIAIVP